MLGGHIPDSFLLAASISNLVRHQWPFLVPSLAILLWLDHKGCQRLYNRVGKSAAIAWSVFVTVAIASFLLWFFFALSSVEVKAYEIRHSQDTNK